MAIPCNHVSSGFTVKYGCVDSNCRGKIWICFRPLKAGGCPPPHHHALLTWLHRRSKQTSSFNFDMNIISYYISLYFNIFSHTFCALTPGPQFQTPHGVARLNIKREPVPKILLEDCPQHVQQHRSTLFGIFEKATEHPQESLQVCGQPPSDGLAELQP